MGDIEIVYVPARVVGFIWEPVETNYPNGPQRIIVDNGTRIQVGGESIPVLMAYKPRDILREDESPAGPRSA
jgi:hypothetical protein